MSWEILNLSRKNRGKVLEKSIWKGVRTLLLQKCQTTKTESRWPDLFCLWYFCCLYFSCTLDWSPQGLTFFRTVHIGQKYALYAAINFCQGFRFSRVKHVWIFYLSAFLDLCFVIRPNCNSITRVATVLEVREIKESQRRWKTVQIVKEIEEKRGKVRENSGNFDRLSEHKRFTTPQVQFDDLSFCQNAKRSHGKFSEIRGTSGKSQGKVKESKSQRSGHPDYKQS